MTTLPGPSDELGERAQRRLAAGFVGALAVGAAVLLPLVPRLILGMQPDVPYYRSPALFPSIALALIAIGAALHCVRLLRGAALATDDIDEPAAHWRVVVLAFLGYAAYAAVVPLVGYVPATALFLFILGRLAGLGWRLPAIVAVVLTALLHLLFVVAFQVWFPAASLLAAA
ncbi:MAG TPA: tripartite tricarboxylate transporter TctB family protein [Ramlibacter sp.]|nr:tripartite tricarboxylate transporter TctB family protein [Ramlibacter sp.]